MEKETLLANLDELLKNIHSSNLPFYRLARKTVDFVCANPGQEEYKIIVGKDDNEFFMQEDPWETNATFGTIFNKIGMKIQSFSSGGGMNGEFISFKLSE